MSVRAIEGRDGMAPPQRAADAPIADILEPVKIHLLEPLRHNLDATILHRRDGFFGEGVHFDEPLFADHRLDDFAAALAAWHNQCMRLRLDRQSLRSDICPQLLAGLKAIHPSAGTSI